MDNGVVKMLTEVRHVPNLTLGIMNDKGYKFPGEDALLRVSKCSLVVMNGVNERSLFIL